jgi:uncharacterized integral membrane protein
MLAGTTQEKQMAHWIPLLVFSSVNKRVAWRLLLPMLVVTGISGAGAKEKALPSLWKEILPAIEENVRHGAMHDVQPYFGASFVFAILGILFLVMVLSRAVDIQLAYFAGRASFALSFLWFICAVMSLLPASLMGLHRIFVVLVVLATLGSQFIRGGTIKFYWDQHYYGDLATQVVFIGTYLAFAWLPLRFALTGR